MMKNVGYGVQALGEKMKRLEFETRSPRENEILLEVVYCGICHSDIHLSEGDIAMGMEARPMVPGHEFIGRVIEVGPIVEVPGEIKGGPKCKKFSVGDYVGAHGIFESCGSCEDCSRHDEISCSKKAFTFGDRDKYDFPTHGGYSKYALLNRFCAINIPQDPEKLKSAAPLMCAGGTAWAPVARNNMSRGNLKIGVIGLGGLGHMAVQYASKINPTNEVVVFSRTDRKKEQALKLGAKGFVAVGQARVEGIADMKDCTPEVLAELGTFDYIIDTVAAEKPVALYLAFLKPRGELLILGLTPDSVKTPFPGSQLLLKQLSIQGVLISGTKEIQDAVDFSFAHDCMPIVEHIQFEQLDSAFKRCVAGDVEFRFVIDVKDSFAQDA